LRTFAQAIDGLNLFHKLLWVLVELGENAHGEGYVWSCHKGNEYIR